MEDGDACSVVFSGVPISVVGAAERSPLARLVPGCRVPATSRGELNKKKSSRGSLQQAKPSDAVQSYERSSKTSTSFAACQKACLRAGGTRPPPNGGGLGVLQPPIKSAEHKHKKPIDRRARTN